VSATPNVERIDREDWREKARSFSDYNFCQLWEYGLSCSARLGARDEKVAIRCDSETIALADARIKKVPLLGSGIAYLSNAPLTRKGPEVDLDTFGLCVQALRNEFVAKRGLILRLLPPVGPPESNTQVSEYLRSAGFQEAKTARPHRTILLDLRPSPEELRASLAKKWRSDLVRAEKQELAVRAGRGEDLFMEFVGLYREMRARKQFESQLDADFYLRLQKELPEEERLLVAIVEKEGTSVAGTVLSLLGDTAVYLLGAASEEGRSLRAAYLLQWRAILTAKEAGLRWYDLGGIDPEEDPGDHRFKSRIGGMDVSAPGPFELLPVGIRGRIVLAAERLYKSIRSPRSKADQKTEPEGASTN